MFISSLELLTVDDIGNYQPLLTKRQQALILFSGLGSSYTDLAQRYHISRDLVRQEIRRAVEVICRAKQLVPGLTREALEKVPLEAPLEILHLSRRTNRVLIKLNLLTKVHHLYQSDTLEALPSDLTQIGSQRLKEINDRLTDAGLPSLSSSRAFLLSRLLSGEHNCSDREVFLLKHVEFGGYTAYDVWERAELTGPGQVAPIIKKALNTLNGNGVLR